MNLTNFTASSFKKKQIVATEGNKGHEDQPFVNFIIFCSKLAFLLTAVLLFGVANSAQAQFTYITNNGTITITGYTGSGGAVAIPNVIDGLPVTDIGTNAFADTALTSVVIPASVTNIGDYAFYDCGLTNVVLGSGLASIGAYAFSGTFQGPVAMGTPPWHGCPITSIIIPNSVATIGDFAFWFCGLTNVLIGSGVTNIGEGAFGGCPLTAIDVVPGNPAYTSLAGELFNHDQSTLVEFPCGLEGSYTIPNSVANIGDYAFYNCTSLTNVVLDNNLISIGAYAFSGPSFYGALYGQAIGCPLTSITFPANVTSIGESAFEGCGNLTSAYFLGNAPDADETVFWWCNGLNTDNGGLMAHNLPGTTGWAEFSTNTGVPTALWTPPYPLILNGSVGMLNNQFGFTISWATNVPVVVEASADLSNPVWTPIATNTLTGGASYFSDPQWTNYPARFYRLK
jgi:hypothetical protein